MLALVLLLSLSAPLSAADSLPEFTVDTATEPLCERPYGSTEDYRAANAGGVAPDEIPRYSRWVLGHQDRLAALDDHLGRFEPGKVVGHFLDHQTQTVVVVVDSGFSDLETMATAIRKLDVPVPTIESDSDPGPEEAKLGDFFGPGGFSEEQAPRDPTPLQVEIRASCVDLAQSIALMNAIAMDNEWRPAQSHAAISWSVRIPPEMGGVVEVTLPFGATGVRRLLEERFAEHLGRIRIVEADGVLRGRMNDGSPHYGGAAIGSLSTNDLCTAGFAMDKNGGRWMVSAGHCTHLQATDFWWSGWPKFYGEEVYSYFPSYDVMLLGDDYQQYSRVIHTDPGYPTTRLVTSKADPYVGQLVCVSGQVTRAVCGIEIQSWTSGQICLVNGGINMCYSPSQAMIGTKYGIIGDVGDSGAPVYYRLSSNRARILGMEVGGQTKSEIILLKTSHIESVTGASVATTCCNNTSW